MKPIRESAKLDWEGVHMKENIWQRGARRDREVQTAMQNKQPQPQQTDKGWQPWQAPPDYKAHAERLANAATKMVAYIDRNWPGKRSERVPVQELREALRAYDESK